MIDRERDVLEGMADLEDSTAGEPEVRRIEGYLREMAEEGAIPADVPLAEAGEDDAFMHGDVEYGRTGSREVAVAEPMTAHDASLVALGDNVRQMTNLIESVGRTLEAQNQRSLRLMERLESVAKALEVLPEDQDRSLEALDAIEETIKASSKPLERLNDRLGALPDMVSAIEEQNRSTKELWSVATRAIAGRLAYGAHEERMRERADGRRRRWRVVGAAAFAVAAFVAGAGLRMDLGWGTVSPAVAEADQGEPTWRITDVRRLPLPAEKRAPAEEDKGPFGVDEEAGRRPGR